MNKINRLQHVPGARQLCPRMRDLNVEDLADLLMRIPFDREEIKNDPVRNGQPVQQQQQVVRGEFLIHFRYLDVMFKHNRFFIKDKPFGLPQFFQAGVDGDTVHPGNERTAFIKAVDRFKYLDIRFLHGIFRFLMIAQIAHAGSHQLFGIGVDEVPVG